MEHVAAPRSARKGRGALTNVSGRFEPVAREAADDGWRGIWDKDPYPPLKTEVTAENPRSMISRNQSPDVLFGQSINPYRGCEHGCVYCFARPTHAYLGLSPGLDFESRLVVKENAAEVLKRDLAKPGYKVSTLQLGANTDPYQSIERKYKTTRSVLEVLRDSRHPVQITTKSDLVLRDLDILAPMAADGLAAVSISVTTLDTKLARIMEPRAPRPDKRLDAIQRLAEAGVPTSILAAPMIPAINDVELETVMRAGGKAGAAGAYYVFLRLPLELRALFTEWLEEHFPERASRVLSHLRQARGGDLYASGWRTRMRGEGAGADMLSKRFHLAAKRLGLKTRLSESHTLRTDLFEAPQAPRHKAAPKAPAGQLSLFQGIGP